MLSGLARNIAITGVAYSLISAIGLLLAPFLIAAYGLAGYGQILLARLFLPSASFGFLDLGLGENATRAIAEANATGNWGRAGRALRLLVVQALLIGLITAVGLALATPFLPELLSIAPGQEAAFRNVLWTSAAMEPLLFLVLLAEGVLKGCERFRQLRSCEVASTLTYAGLAVAAVLAGLPSHFVAFALLAGLGVRMVLAFAFARAALRGTPILLRHWDEATRREIGGWTRTMIFNKVLGTFQTQAALPLLGLLVGPAAVGAFDAVVRIPRFTKAVFSLIGSTVLPLASRLRVDADTSGTARLGTVGIVGAMALCGPPTFAAMAYSHSILHFWIGDTVAGFWPWQSLMFVVSLLSIAISFGGAILLADRPASRLLNRLTAIQVLIQVTLSLALLPWLSPWSFVLGQAISVLVVFPLQFRTLRASLGLASDVFGRLVRICVISAAIALSFRLIWPDVSMVELLIMLCAICLVSWSVLPRLALDPQTRAVFDEGRRRTTARFAMVLGAIVR